MARADEVVRARYAAEQQRVSDEAAEAAQELHREAQELKAVWEDAIQAVLEDLESRGFPDAELIIPPLKYPAGASSAERRAISEDNKMAGWIVHHYTTLGEAEPHCWPPTVYHSYFLVGDGRILYQYHGFVEASHMSDSLFLIIYDGLMKLAPNAFEPPSE